MRSPAQTKLRLYGTALACAALAVTAASIPHAAHGVTTGAPLAWLIAGTVVIAAVTSAWLRSHSETAELGGVGAALPSAFGLMLTAGTPVAVVTLTTSLAVAALARRRTLRTLTDSSAHVLSVAATGYALTVVGGRSDVLATPTATFLEFCAITLGVGLLFLLDVTLTSASEALSQRVPVRQLVLEQLGRHLTTGIVLLSLPAVVIVVATASPTLVPLLALPIVAIYRNSRAMVATEHLALHDALTGLPNRRLFLERLDAAIHESGDRGSEVAVLLIDLDRFKEVNDRLGHHVGDLLLQAVGPMLREGVDDDVTVARMGGDEFALCVPDVDGADEAVRVAKRIISRLSLPIAIDTYTIDIGASVGIALAPSQAADVSTVLQRADIAMYVAKDARAGYEVYSESRDPNRRQRITSYSDLRHATELDQLVVHFQPKAEMRTGVARGVEALVRWQHPTLGLVGPAEFIPMAERSGMMGAITTFVLARALEQCRAWCDEGLNLRLAVNLSVQSLYDDAFPGLVAGLLERSGIAASQLVLDVTEATVTADPRRAQQVLADLGELGVTLAIDDFGTGYSSLAYLKQLPVSELKIDSSFVLGMANDSDDAIIVHSTIDLGQKFGLEVVAEGVESERVWLLLSRLGCNLAQGSYVCPPLPATQVTGWLRDNATRHAPMWPPSPPPGAMTGAG